MLSTNIPTTRNHSWRGHSPPSAPSRLSETHLRKIIITKSIQEQVQPKETRAQASASRAGKIKHEVLSKEGRTKLNVLPDHDFYSFLRFVTHVDDGFISTLTNLYRERLRPEWEILDLMSSWVSHLLEEVRYKRVAGHGLNAQELARNPRLKYFIIKDLHQEQRLEFSDCSFDAMVCTVSVQYLQQPEKVFAEVFRILNPGGAFIISFSNRMFYEKAISSWRAGTPYSRVQLVVQYFQCIEGFTQPEIIRKLPSSSSSPESRNAPFNWFSKFFDLFAGGSDPFYAVLSYKNFRPLSE